MGESAKEWHFRQGGDADCVSNGFGWRYYRNGAKMESNAMGLGARYEPPDDPVELAQVQVLFYTIKLEQTEEKFRALEHYLHNYVAAGIKDSRGFLQPPEDSEIQELERIQKNVLILRKKLQKHQEKLESIDPNAKRKKQQEVYADKVHSEHEAVLTRLKSIRI